jgi:excisionase family DNA binding protein
MIADRRPLDRRATRLLASDPMARMVDGEEYLTVDEAARLLGVKPATLYAYVSRGVLKSYRQGMKRQRLYRRVEVESLTKLERGGPPDIPPAETWIRD